ncbi:MAG: hypothetical protein ACRDQC_07505 [Gaiellales bacterium]
MGHHGRTLLVTCLAVVAGILLVAGTTVWSVRPHATPCVGSKTALESICERVPVAPVGQRLHPLRAELLWTGGVAAGGAALVLAASAKRRRPPNAAQPLGG